MAPVSQDFISINTMLDSLGIETESPDNYDAFGWSKDSDGNWTSNFVVDPKTGELHKK